MKNKKVYNLYGNKPISQESLKMVMKRLNESSNFSLIEIYRKYQNLKRLGAFADFPSREY